MRVFSEFSKLLLEGTTILLRDIGKVVAITARREGVTEILVAKGHDLARAINYEKLTGTVDLGDTVVLNTTARILDLGTGGYDFVIHVVGKGKETEFRREPGHIMKLRYTPCQFSCLAVEEQESPQHAVMATAESLNNLPVICGSLHSILPAAAAAVKWRSNHKARVAYIMTDGAALPLAWSQLVSRLLDSGLLDHTITVGHAFGGELEAVNLYSGLLAARHVLGADVVIVCMGPGIVGTGTKYGFSGIELGEIVNAVSILHGIPVAVPRISFADKRPRHQGISHHTITALGRVALRPAILALPFLDRKEFWQVREQLEEGGVWQKHRVVMADGKKGLEILSQLGIKVTTMGRGMEEESCFFTAAAAAGIIAWELHLARARGVHPGLGSGY
ncbi:MAG TPA: DUF3866 family protein [Firmicutes bacterium]|nr:DUF3866 family protein [Bacillota bacterium]